tara:strand:- start:2085 stop:2747 length:663 start_codon:yes stop_codon:yes gene_type:complete
MRDSAIIYRSFYEAIHEHSDEIQAEIWRAICEYSFDKKEANLTGVSKSIFTLIKPQLAANIKRFENGKKEKKKQTVSKTKAKPKQVGSKGEANKNVNANVNPNGELELESEFEISISISWERWLKFRSDIKKPFKSEDSKLLCFEKLKTLSGGSPKLAERIILQSIENGWQGLFEYKGSTATQPAYVSGVGSASSEQLAEFQAEQKRAAEARERRKQLES